MISAVMGYLEKEGASIYAISHVNGNSHQTTSVSARLYNNMIIIISFRLELIPPRGAVNHSDPSSPLLPVTSIYSFQSESLHVLLYSISPMHRFFFCIRLPLSP